MPEVITSVNSKKIAELPNTVQLFGPEIFPISQDNITKFTTFDVLGKYFSTLDPITFVNFNTARFLFTNNIVALGYNGLRLSSGSTNISVGFDSLSSNTTGSDNTAIGYRVLYLNKTGSNNTGIGDSALNKNLSGDNNTGFGYLALQENIGGSNNFEIGRAHV